MTLGHIRLQGVRRLLIYCSAGLCHHSATIDADHWPDETAVRDLCPKAVWTKCGMIGADVLTNGFSKKIENHAAAVGLYVANYNGSH